MKKYTKNFMITIGIIFQVRLSQIIKLNLLFFIMLFILSCKSIEGQRGDIQYDKFSRKYVYVFVEEMPRYKEGNSEFLKALIKNIEFNFKKENIKTRVKLQFVIDKKGHLVGARIYNKNSKELTNMEKSILKELSLMGDWQPGKHNNKPVNVLLTESINICPNN